MQSSNDEVKEINNNKIKADTYVQLTTAGIISPEEARKALAEDEKSGFNSIDIDAVPEMELGGAFEASPFPTSPLSETASARACRSTAEQDKLIEEKAGNEDLFGGLGLNWDPFAYDEFDESKVHRKANGQFGSGGSNESFGKAYNEYSGKPKEAIEYLLKEKNGYVPNAIYKEGIGNIDIVWGEAGTGKGGYGLAHIIRRRNEEGYDGEEFVKQLPDIINNGKVYKKEGHTKRIYVGTETAEIAIKLEWEDKDKIWLVSGYVKKP